MAKIKDIAKEQSSKDLAKRFANNEVKEVTMDNSTKATNRNVILPISDFEKVIEHDKIYLGTLQSLQANLSLHERNLARRLSPIKDNESDRLKRAKEFIEWDETRLKMYDVRGQIETHTKLLNDKRFHFENIAIPQFNKEVEEMAKDDNFKKEMDRSLAFSTDVMGSSKLSEKGKEILNEIRTELKFWDSLEDKSKDNKEYMLYTFKAIRRLNNALEGEKQNK